MGSASHEYRHLEFSGQHSQTVNVVRVFVRNQNGGQGVRIFAQGAHALDGFATRNSRVHENPGARTGNDGAVSPASASQHRNRNTHVGRILARAVETRVTIQLADTFGVDVGASVLARVAAFAALSHERDARAYIVT